MTDADDDRSFEIRREVALRATPAQVWRAISTSEGLAGWFMPMPMDPDAEMIEAWEPDERLAVRTPTGDDGSFNAFEYVIEGRDGGTTVLRFVHHGMTGDDWPDGFEEMTGHGWDQYLFTLAQYLEHFADRTAVYAEAEGPGGSNDPDAWARLLRSVGPTGDAEPPPLGTKVRVELPDGEVLDGTVDYTALTFLGIRTADALVRFHGRWIMGMPVAVSHHAFRPGVDVTALATAWAAWLAEATA